MKALEEFDKIIILSIDDDEFNQALASSIFEEFENVTVLEAGHGKEALEMLETEVVDIILLDILMPIMDGIETLKILKSNPEYKSIPVIVVTSKEDEKRTTYQLGA
ncbi:MAG TPA: response regulator, partial [Campylobacterales bacterium]|nr:response regulator [Campylobacterales bacterium]